MTQRNRYIDLQNLKQRIPVVEFYMHEQELNRVKTSGKWMEGGTCPFHDDRKPGSFYIHKEIGCYQCFSCGAKGADFVSFIMEKYDLSFKEALMKLVKEWGV
ncbi:CHC2 zinc finger domain-containing protein [Chlamydiales bacterium]|nr:CHC2 zinc finger domain-containing protein [Chlamydiales bacterium]